MALEGRTDEVTEPRPVGVDVGGHRRGCVDREEAAAARHVPLERAALRRLGQHVAARVHEHQRVVDPEVAVEAGRVVGGVDPEVVLDTESFDRADRVGNRQMHETDGTVEHQDAQPRAVDVHRNRALASRFALVSSTRCGCSL